MLGRIGLALYPKNPGILYATVDNQNSPGVSDAVRYEELRAGKRPGKPTVGHVIYRTDDGGTRWRQVSLEGQSIGGRSNYYAQIIVDPNDENHVYVLSTRVIESTDGGKTWRKAFRYAGDNHVLWINPRDSRHILLGYDYGFAITKDAGENWYHADELPLAQFYAIGVDMDYPYNVYGGTQDNSGWKGPSTKKGRFPIRFEDWELVMGGDVYYAQVDPTNSRWLYTENNGRSIQKVDQKTGQRRRIAYRGNPDIRFNWNTPIHMSPHNPDVIYQGANILLRSSFRGENREEISPDLTDNDPAKYRGVEVGSYGTITTIAESPVEKGVIWVGTDDGNVQLTRDDGKTWTKLNDRITGNPGYWVTRVTASHHDAGTVYVTYTGIFRDDFRPFVYKSTDYGESWTSIAGNLRDEPINVIKEDHKNPNLLFVGTDKAVYVTIDGGRHWTRMKNNMPTNPVHDLVIHPRENDLVVGTHGRSFFITDISPLQELTEEVLAKDEHLFEIEPKVQWVMTRQPTASAQIFTGENEPLGVVINYYLKNPVVDDATITVYQGTRIINELTGTADAGLNSVVWYMTKRSKRTDEEVARWERRERSAVNREELYDYYDSVDHFFNADDEVTKTGRSIGIWVHEGPGITEREYALTRVQPGEYTIQLTVNDHEIMRKAVILQDQWYDK